jgi:protein-L-isoaspartate(D-aspartate) O-methyltransferase
LRRLGSVALSPVGIFPCIGAVDADAEADRRLGAAIARGVAPDAVHTLRRDAHEPAATCWLHGEGFCLSQLDVE